MKAVQEQQIQIEKRQRQLEEFKNEIGSLKQDDVHTINGSILNEAIPNPTKGIAHIPYRLPAGMMHAQLLITDMTGKIINVIALNSSDNVDVNTIALSSGVYNYSLQADGKILQTKKLVVAH